MAKRIPKSKIFYLILIIILIILFHYIGILKPLENLITKGFSYPLNWAYTASQSVSEPIENVTGSVNLSEENEGLKEKVIRLENKVIQLEEILSQNEILSSQLDLLKQKNIQSIPAKVISRGINQNHNLLIINRGLKDNLKQGLAVTIKDGLVVGKLVNVFDTISHVLLLTDSNSEINATILNEDREDPVIGILKGKLNISLELSMIPKNRKIKIGDVIFTSGIEETIPSGLLLGEVSEISQDERDLFKTAKIWQPTDTNNITIVNVILP
ncbi:MAG: rod shape-determining protein MreC [Patescibacteria group bacterium]